VVSLAGDIAVIEEALLLNLERLTKEGFVSRDLALVASCFYSYQAVGKMETAEEIFRKVIVEPRLEKIMERQ
jgi:hypothetical protein